jgi:hypothetical protein
MKLSSIGYSCGATSNFALRCQNALLSAIAGVAPIELRQPARVALPCHFLAVYDEYLVTGAKDDRTFANLSGMEFVNMRGRVIFDSGLCYIETLGIDDYGLIVGKLTESRLTVWSPIVAHALHQA